MEKNGDQTNGGQRHVDGRWNVRLYNVVFTQKSTKKIMKSLFNKPKQNSAIALRGKRILILCMARIHGRDF